MSSQEACDFVSERLKVKATNISGILKELLHACLSDDPSRTMGLGGDNMTAILILLNQNKRRHKFMLDI